MDRSRHGSTYNRRSRGAHWFAAAAISSWLGLALPAGAAEPGPTVIAAKSAAILGGGPSRLQQISSAQNGASAAAVAMSEPPVQPLGSISTSTPDIFGSVALGIGRTPLDDRWRRVAASGVGAARGPWRAMLQNARAADRARQLDQVNQWVNGRIAFAEDAREYGVADHWATAGQSLRRGKGDCEDYAIAKMQLLRTLGFRSEDLYIVMVRDLVRRADHAVLVVRIDGRFVVLDNGTDRVLDAGSIRDYRPILSYNAEKAWIHGYRSQPMRLAASRTSAPGL